MGEEERKQDYETNAFQRLAEKIKKAFPRLPVILLKDSLYVLAPVMDICRENVWGDLSSVIKARVSRTLQGNMRKSRKRGKGKKRIPVSDGYQADGKGGGRGKKRWKIENRGATVRRTDREILRMRVAIMRKR